ncbi:MAG: MBOAT family O-acyltransferase [Clostridium sp.]
MVFSSLIFLFIFLPFVLVGYFTLRNSYRNYFLLFVSLFFYAYGEPSYVLVMLSSILANYIFGILVSNTNLIYRKISIILAVTFNLGMLGVFKYSGFIIENINEFLGTSLQSPNVSLPLGISFFTFQALSYVIDVYRMEVKPQRNIFDLALYISLFPQLVAGPIVRYQTVADEIKSRKHSIEGFSEGVNRFMIGMFKKVLIANPLGGIADSVFALPTQDISLATTWIGILAYSLQIFFDFSGYSDMAIGLGKMFGFNFLENFNYPYISKSVSEFWRRWHMSLGSFFRDYVYIPLGGNKVGPIRLYFNLFVVWMLTGFWHGAAWNFIAWGLYFGLFIALEKAFLGKLLKRVSPIISHTYLLLIVIIGWVFFRAPDFTYAINYIKNMLGIGVNALYDNLTIIYLHDSYIVFILGILFSTPIVKYIKNIILKKKPVLINNVGFYILQSSVYIALFLLVIITLVNSSYNPLLYFRF